MKRLLQICFLTMAALPLATLGCHAQVAATTHIVTLSGTAPSTCGSSTCTYLFSRVTVTTGTTSCPTATTSTYTALNSGSEATSVAYTDKTAAGLTVCYVAQTDLSGAYSDASNTVGPLVVPANPTAPTTVTGAQSTTTAKEETPPLGPVHTTQVADSRIPTLKIKGEVR